eukprot:5527164-Pleurochrysis_carterae.AAC.1
MECDCTLLERGKREAGSWRQKRGGHVRMVQIFVESAPERLGLGRKLLLKWDNVQFSECIFDAIPEFAAPTASESGPAAASASGASSLPSDEPTHHSDGLGRALGKPAKESSEKPPGAGSCTSASHTPSLGAGTCSSTILPAGSSSMMPPVGEAEKRTPTIRIPDIPRPAAHVDADAVAVAGDAAAAAAAAARATPAPLAAGRHAAT